jgi:hypothetical protein
VIVITESLWDELLDAIRKPKGKVERVAFLDGVVAGAVATVTTVVVPNATLKRGYYDVSAEAMSEAGKHLRRFRLQRIAQVHTHEAGWVGHSERDDELAYSHEDDAVSIVLPHHGKHRPTPRQAGVHVCENQIWRELELDEIDELIRMVPTTLSFRR